MNKLFQPIYGQGQTVKQITDEQINECMQFCAMYNILHAIHNYKIQLKNVNNKKKVKAKNKQPLKSVKGLSQQGRSKEVSKKVSRFQKPKISKKKQTQNKNIHQQPQSEVDNYNYQHQEHFATSRLIEQPLSSSNKKPTYGNYNENSQGQNNLYKQNDLSQLILNLAVTNQQNTLKKINTQQKPSQLSGYYMNSAYQQSEKNKQNEESSPYQSKYFKNQHPQTETTSSYLSSNNIYKTNTILPLNNPQSYYQSSNEQLLYNNQTNSYNQNNPYSKASYQGVNYNVNHFMQHPLTKSPSQYTNSTSLPYTSQFDPTNNYTQNQNNMQKSYLSRNLFNQQNSSISNSSKKKDTNYQNPQNYFQPQQNKFTPNYPNTHQSQYQYQQQKQQIYPNQKPQQITQNHKNQGTPSKIQTPRSTSRSVSPLGTSNSCRNFFMKSPRDVSDDKSQASRSKSRRKQRPGGSKSFYQPLLSGRKVISKQKQQQTPSQYIKSPNYYQPQEQVLFTNKNEEYQAPYFKQQQQEEAISQYQKKHLNRMTRQTDISAVSGNQQKSYPQKTAKSQQVIVSQQLSKKNSQINYQNNQNNYEESNSKMIKKYKKMTKLSESSDHSSERSQEVQLQNIEVQMQELRNSRKKIPIPMKFDSTKKQTEIKKYKK